MTDRDPLQQLWTRQPKEPLAMSIAEIHARAASFQSKVHNRNINEYAAAVLVIGIFGWMAVIIPEPMVRAGAGLIILGTLYICWKLNTGAGASAKSELDAAVSITEFHRAQLVRQRTALATIWRWYLAPLVPGMLVFMGGSTFVGDASLPLSAQIAGFAIRVSFTAAIFGFVWWLNARAVKALDRQIAELDRARKSAV